MSCKNDKYDKNDKPNIDSIEALSASTARRTCNMIRSRRRTLLWLVATIASILLLARTAYVVANRRADLQAMGALQKAMTSLEHPPPPNLELDGNRKILIVQHVRGKRLDRASELGHKLYAAAWGYRHKTTHGNYCGRKVHGSFNKIFVLRDEMREELRTKKADWIMYTDADTIVSDPSVAIHQLLPPTSLSPEPLVLASQDHNGFNAGVLLIRVHPTTLQFLEDLISDTLLPGKLSDQHYMGLRLRTQPKYRDHFYEIPKHWFNSYWLDEVGKDPWHPSLHVHLVNWLSDTISWRPMMRQAVRIARDAKEAYTKAYNVKGAVKNSIFGFELMPQYSLTAASAARWWNQAVNGAVRMRFLDENGDGRRIDGSEYDPARRFIAW